MITTLGEAAVATINLFTEEITFQRVENNTIHTINYRVLEYGTGLIYLSRFLKVNNGDQVEVKLATNLSWSNLQIFFSGPTPFDDAWAITRIDDPNVGKGTLNGIDTFTFPMMGTPALSTINMPQGGITSFRVRLELSEAQMPHTNNVLWLDPEIIVDGEIG